jgi:hypothetical protein
MIPRALVPPQSLPSAFTVVSRVLVADVDCRGGGRADLVAGIAIQLDD